MPWTEVYLDGRKLGMTPMQRVVIPSGRQELERYDDVMAYLAIRIGADEGRWSNLKRLIIGKVCSENVTPAINECPVVSKLVEDAETLSVVEQSDFIGRILFFREHLQDLIVSETFQDFEEGTGTHERVFEAIEYSLQQDLAIRVRLDELDSPRGFLDLQNYLDRAQWQKNKNAETMGAG